MSGQPDILQVIDQRHQETIVTTQRGVVARLADPYLTDHDRWVLRQFARFLGGRAPGPDPRVVRMPPVRPVRPLYTRVRRSNL
jgi:hypothetical protein